MSLRSLGCMFEPQLEEHAAFVMDDAVFSVPYSSKGDKRNQLVIPRLFSVVKDQILPMSMWLPAAPALTFGAYRGIIKP